MQITFSTNKMERKLDNRLSIRKYFGKLANNIINRMSELIAADNLEQISHLPPPRRHKLVGNYADCWGIDCSMNCRIVIKPTGEYDQTDLTTIKCVQILNIEDYH